MAYTGQCTCGKVKLTVEGDAIQTRQCWCRQCQKMSGGGPTNNVIFQADAVRVDGELGSNVYTAASGNQVTWWFCPSCGGQIQCQTSGRPQFRVVRLGALDEPHGLRPQVAIWMEEAPAWASVDPAMDQFQRSPPVPAAPNS